MPQGTVDGEGLAEAAPHIDAIRERIGDRLADISVADHRNGYIVAIVNLTSEDAEFVASRSTRRISFEAVPGLISEAALVAIAEDLVDSEGLSSPGLGVGVDTGTSRITVATPEPLTSAQRADALVVADRALARASSRGVPTIAESSSGRQSEAPVDELVTFITATASPAGLNPSDFRASNPMRGGSWINGNSPTSGACTASFLLRKGSSRRYLTAAHCSTGTSTQIETYTNNHVGWVSKRGVGGFDVETFSLANHDDVSAIRTSPSDSREVSDVISAPENGQRRCFTGRGSAEEGKEGDRCSTQGQMWYTAPITGLPVRGYRCIDSISAELGDSGGPVYDYRSDGAAIAVGVMAFRIDQSGIGGIHISCYSPIADVLASLPGWSVGLSMSTK